MKLAIDESADRLVVLDSDQVRLYDVSTEDPRPLATVPVPAGQWLAAADRTVAVLAGGGPHDPSIEQATVIRLGWDLSERGRLRLDAVERRGISLTRDGNRLAYVHWATCEVVLVDLATGATIGRNGESIPSGASFSPDGRYILAGTADQGDGAILLFDTRSVEDGRLAMAELPGPDPSPGLDDAPYFSVFAPSGRLAALSNQSWGGRGLFIYDMTAQKPLWSRVLGSSDEDDDLWYPYAIAFAADESIVLAAQPDTISAFAAGDGRELGDLPVEAETRAGFAVDNARRRVWIGGSDLRSYPFPDGWRA